MAAKEHWSLETGAADTSEPTEADLEKYIEPYSDDSDIISDFYCPLDPNKTFDSSYSINDIETDPACKIEPGTHNLD